MRWTPRPGCGFRARPRRLPSGGRRAWWSAPESATARLVHEWLVAGEEAPKEGISVEVVDPRTLLPLDEDALVSSVKKTNRCVVAHEAIVRMGFGAEVAAVVQYGAF